MCLLAWLEPSRSYGSAVLYNQHDICGEDCQPTKCCEKEKQRLARIELDDYLEAPTRLSQCGLQQFHALSPIDVDKLESLCLIGRVGAVLPGWVMQLPRQRPRSISWPLFLTWAIRMWVYSVIRSDRESMVDLKASWRRLGNPWAGNST